MIRLKTCPFCGGMGLHHWDPEKGYAITCQRCYIEGPHGDTVKDSEELWNTRTNSWIPVDKQLPPENEEVLTAREHANYVRPAVYTQYGWIGEAGYFSEFPRVTHWMPEPELPQE